MSMTRQEEIFVFFLKRDNWFNHEALKEITFLRGKTRDEYLITVRLGATRQLNRVGKILVWETWMNAGNHAAFEEEIDDKELNE